MINKLLNKLGLYTKGDVQRVLSGVSNHIENQYRKNQGRQGRWTMTQDELRSLRTYIDFYLEG